MTTAAPVPDFKVFQSLWGMEGLPFGGAAEWSLREKLDRIVNSGFDGVEAAWSSTFPIGEEALELLPEYELEWTLVCSRSRRTISRGSRTASPIPFYGS
jgi:hypothetical protein